MKSLPYTDPFPIPRAVVSNMYWIPESDVDAHRVRQHFTVIKSGMNYQTKQREHTEIPVWRTSEDRPGWIGVPLAEGEALFPADVVDEELSDGGEPFNQWTRLPDPEHENAAPGQDRFMQLTWQAVAHQYSALVKAETGTGKTIVALWLAATLGVRTLVLVPKSAIMSQWIGQAVDVLGLTKDQIGRVVGPKCQYDRQFVVGMMKSNAVRTYPPEFYRAFGLVIYDELHNTGAPQLSETVGLFNAQYKLGLTATDKRKDGADRVYHSYFGKPAFSHSMPGLPTTVAVVSLDTPRVYGATGMMRAKQLSGIRERNETIRDIALHWYEQGQHILLVTETVDHAEHMATHLEASGVPGKHIGLFVGALSGAKGGRSATTQEYLAWVKKHPPVVIATYGMMKEAVDIPRLTRGLDMTPRGDMVQLLGRIRRRQQGKQSALWVTFRERKTGALEGTYMARMKSIQSLSGVTVRKMDLADVLRS